MPVVTPVTATGRLDEEALARVVDLMAQSGHGAFVLGTTGEAPSVPVEARRRVVRRAVAAAAGRIPVLAGIAGNCLDDAVAAGKEYLRLGADAVVALPPSYFQLSPSELHEFLDAVVLGVGGPVFIYNIPQTTHHSIPVEVMERLAERTNVVGFKDSESTPGRVEAVAAALAGRPDFALLVGVAASSVAALERGFDGMVPSSGNLVPEPWKELWDAAGAGDWEKARMHQHALDRVGDVLNHGRSIGQGIAALKSTMADRGLCSPAVLPPLRPLDAATAERVRQALAALRITALAS